MNGKILTRGRCVALTHNLTQNRKNAMETMAQRGLESISHRAEKLLKMLKTVKSEVENMEPPRAPKSLCKRQNPRV